MPVLPSHSHPSLTELGWDEDWVAALAALAAEAGPGLRPARVSRPDRGVCTVLAPEALRVANGPHRVVAGDWVAIGAGQRPADRPAVTAILPRRSAFVRDQSGARTQPQVVAANVDVVFIVESLDTGINVGRIERYLTLGWQSGALPVVVLTKSDRCLPEVTADSIARVGAVALGAEVHAVSAASGAGIHRLSAHLGPGRTTALLGLSGAGKSTLVNRLAGTELMATAAVRGDGKGRHTTTHRQLLVLPGGGLLIDTPGMRALGLWDADQGLAQTFADVDSLVGACRFSDCLHISEPDCAVLGAVDAGALSPSRLASWRTLQGELHSLAARQRDRAAREDSLSHRKAIARANRQRGRER